MTTTHQDTNDASLFEQIGEEDYRCTVCGGVNTTETEAMPSMAGFGSDSSETCTRCGSSQSSSPFGTVIVRKPIPTPERSEPRQRPTAPMTGKQRAFLQRLIAERLNPEQREEAERTLDYLNTREASRCIDELLAKPKRKVETDKAEPPEGVHVVDGTIYKVQRSRTSGTLYAKVLHVERQQGERWAYVGRQPFHLLSEATFLTPERAAEFGILHGVCCVCGKDLSVELSVELGIGPVCGKRLHAQARLAKRVAKAVA